MDLNEATKILANNGYTIDEGIGNFVKKARRAVFGKNKDDEDILAKRRARQEQQAKTHADDEKQREGTLSASDDYTSDVLRYLQDEEEYRAIYEILVKLRKKYGKYIMYSNALTPHRISVSAVYQKNSTSREMAGKYSDRNGGKYASAPVDRKQYSFCKVGEIGLLATDRFNYSDRKGGFGDNDSNAHMKYATSVENAMNGKYTETDDIKEWAVEINDLVNEIVNTKSKDAANDWEQNIDQNESVKVKQAVNILKENGYIVEGHWYDSTTGFRRYREEPDEREARYYNTLEEKFKELKEADEAQDKERIRFHLETIEIFVRRIGHAISSSDKKGLAKDGLAKMKKYFQDKGQDDLAALVDKYADEVIRLVW